MLVDKIEKLNIKFRNNISLWDNELPVAVISWETLHYHKHHFQDLKFWDTIRYPAECPVSLFRVCMDAYAARKGYFLDDAGYFMIEANYNHQFSVIWYACWSDVQDAIRFSRFHNLKVIDARSWEDIRKSFTRHEGII